MDRLAALGIGDVAAVAQQAELLHGHARNLQEHIRRDDLIKLIERRALVAVGHQERGNRSGEATQMVTDTALNGLLLALPFGDLYLAHHGLAGALYQLVAGVFEALHEALTCILELRVVSTVDFIGFVLRLCNLKLVCTILLNTLFLYGKVAHLSVKLNIHVRLDTTFHLLLLRSPELAAVVLIGRLNERLRDAVAKNLL